MRIAFSLGSLNPGGGEKQNCNLMAQFQEHDYEVHAVLPNGAGNMEGNLKPFLEQRRIPMYSLDHHVDKSAAMQPVFERIKPDVTVHAGYPMTLHGAIASFRAGVRRRIIRMETAGLVRQQFPQDPYLELCGNAAADYVVGNSQAVVDSFAVYSGMCDCRYKMVPNGVFIPDNLKALRSVAREYWSTEDPTIVIGHLANFRQDGVKNQLMLVRAAKILVDMGADFRLLMCGYKTEYQDKVEKLIADLDMGDYVRIPGRIDNLDLLAGWDIGVNASTTEGFSNALQECMAYGMPIVATRAGGNGESVKDGETGFLVPSDDEESMAVALLRLIEDAKLRKKLGTAARKYMQDNFGWDAVISQWEGLF